MIGKHIRNMRIRLFWCAICSVHPLALFPHYCDKNVSAILSRAAVENVHVHRFDRFRCAKQLPSTVVSAQVVGGYAHIFHILVRSDKLHLAFRPKWTFLAFFPTCIANLGTRHCVNSVPYRKFVFMTMDVLISVDSYRSSMFQLLVSCGLLEMLICKL